MYVNSVFDCIDLHAKLQCESFVELQLVPRKVLIIYLYIYHQSLHQKHARVELIENVIVENRIKYVEYSEAEHKVHGEGMKAWLKICQKKIVADQSKQSSIVFVKALAIATERVHDEFRFCWVSFWILVRNAVLFLENWVLCLVKFAHPQCPNHDTRVLLYPAYWKTHPKTDGNWSYFDMKAIAIILRKIIATKLYRFDCWNLVFVCSVQLHSSNEKKHVV